MSEKFEDMVYTGLFSLVWMGSVIALLFATLVEPSQTRMSRGFGILLLTIVITAVTPTMISRWRILLKR